MGEKLRALIYVQQLETIIYKMSHRIALVPSEEAIVDMILSGTKKERNE